MTASGGEAGGKPGVAGVHTNQRLSLSMPWEGPRKIGQGFKPDSGNLTVRDYRGASGNVRHGGNVTPPCDRKSGSGNPSPTAGRVRFLSQCTKVRVLSIPAIRDRVVQGAFKLILEPIFEADFQPGSFGYRPKKTAHEAVDRVAQAIVRHKTRVIDFDLRNYFDNVRHDRLLAEVAKRVDDDDVMHLLKIMLKANGRCGVPQGGVVSPLLSNIYLNEVDRMLERAKEATRYGEYTGIEYARFADDLVILIDAH